MFPGALETNLSETDVNGTSVTASATPHTKGSWVELIASTGAASQGVIVMTWGVFASGTDTGALLDIGVGAAASEVVTVPDINVGAAPGAGDVGKMMFAPVQIASGSRVSARLQGVVGSEQAEVAVWLIQSVQNLENISSLTAYGVVSASSRGTLVTPATGSWGSWTEIATSSADHNLWMFGVDQGGDTTTFGEQHLLQFGFGGTVAPATTVAAPIRFVCASSEYVGGPFPDVPIYADVASGSKLWIRLTGDRTEARGVTIYGGEGTAVSGAGGGGIKLVGRGGGLVG